MISLRARLSCYNFKLQHCQRYFSTTTPSLRLAPLPRYLRRGRQPVPKTPGKSKLKWPLQILQQAIQSGFLKVSLDTASKILDAFTKQGPSSASRLCKEYDIKPNTLTNLARVLLRSGHQEIARDLILASARLADDNAILLVIKEAIKLDDLSSPKVALIYQQRFRPMLQRSHPGALYLEGQRLENEGQVKRALEIYEEIVAANTAETFEVLSDIGAADIWKALGKLRAKQMDRKGAEAALRTAALQYNDSAALFQLAKVFTSPTSDEYEFYLLKAAASGEARATYELGLLYYNHSQAIVEVARQESSKELPIHTGAASNNPRATMKRRKAQEWFSIGAESGNIGSQVYLAILLRESGKLADGLRWLTAAGNPEDVDPKEFHAWRPIISHIANLWYDSTVDLTRLDLNAIQRDGLTKPGSDTITT